VVGNDALNVSQNKLASTSYRKKKSSFEGEANRARSSSNDPTALNTRTQTQHRYSNLDDILSAYKELYDVEQRRATLQNKVDADSKLIQDHGVAARQRLR